MSMADVLSDAVHMLDLYLNDPETVKRYPAGDIAMVSACRVLMAATRERLDAGTAAPLVESNTCSHGVLLSLNCANCATAADKAVFADAPLILSKAAAGEIERRGGGPIHEVGEGHVEEPDPDACTNPKGHRWVHTGTAYGGDDERWSGEGRCYCEHCGADGDA